MRSMRIVTVVGARPQFVKAAMVSAAMRRHNAESGDSIVERMIHTGQHYDAKLSQVFFDELSIPPPVANLDVGSGPHGDQTARMLERLEPAMRSEMPDAVVVYGDTNSTLAGAMAAVKLGIPVVHVEAGLRSQNRRMPEEINRVLADRISTLLMCPTAAAVENLHREGIDVGVHRTGDVMYDAARHYAARAAERSRVLSALSLVPDGYVLATVHRAENTDDADRLREIVLGLRASSLPVIWPIHPRTRARLDATRRNGLSPCSEPGNPIGLIEPVSYLDMLELLRHARFVVTDSGGVQKEAYFFARPCVTLRRETEWVELVAAGWNRLAGGDEGEIAEAMQWAARFDGRDADSGLYGDGHAAERIVEVMHRWWLES